MEAERGVGGVGGGREAERGVGIAKGKRRQRTTCARSHMTVSWGPPVGQTKKRHNPYAL